MTHKHVDEIKANLERAQQAVNAARELAAGGYTDFAASRAYYAAFYAATALLLSEELSFGKHSAVLSFIHKEFVRKGKLSKTHGKNLNWLFELRGVGDYGVTLHVSQRDANRAIQVASDFLLAIKELLQPTL
jgi:uncharacterized protein (UPF0332 family)